MDYPPEILKFREYCLAKGISADAFDRVMKLEIPTLETLQKMRDEGKLKPKPRSP